MHHSWTSQFATWVWICKSSPSEETSNIHTSTTLWNFPPLVLCSEGRFFSHFQWDSDMLIRNSWELMILVRPWVIPMQKPRYTFIESNITVRICNRTIRMGIHSFLVVPCSQWLVVAQLRIDLQLLSAQLCRIIWCAWSLPQAYLLALSHLLSIRMNMHLLAPFLLHWCCIGLQIWWDYCKKVPRLVLVKSVLLYFKTWR